MILVLSSIVLFAQTGSVQFSVSATPGTVFVRQQISYDASLRVHEVSPPRFLTPPQYIPPDITGGDVYHFPFDTVRSVQDVTVDGVRFKQYTYHSAIFPVTAGVDTILPPTLTYTLLNPADPYLSHGSTVHGAEQRVIVLPLPIEGRPSDFSGAVGEFTIATVAGIQGLRTGNPFSVRVTIAGTGDLALLQPPALAIPWATVVSMPDSIMWDSTGTLMHGFKEFHWLVTPQSGGHRTIPQIRYSYFNPTTKTYATAVAAPIPVTIAGGSAATSENDTLAVRVFSRLLHTLRQHVILLLGIVVLTAAIAWGVVRRHRMHNS